MVGLYFIDYNNMTIKYFYSVHATYEAKTKYMTNITGDPKEPHQGKLILIRTSVRI